MFSVKFIFFYIKENQLNGMEKYNCDYKSNVLNGGCDHKIINTVFEKEKLY